MKGSQNKVIRRVFKVENELATYKSCLSAETCLMKCCEKAPLVQNNSLSINHKPVFGHLLWTSNYWRTWIWFILIPLPGSWSGWGEMGRPRMIHQVSRANVQLFTPNHTHPKYKSWIHWIQTQIPAAIRLTTVLARFFQDFKKPDNLGPFFPCLLITKCSRLWLHFLLISCFQKYLERTLRFAVSQHSCHHHKTHGCDSYSQV